MVDEKNLYAQLRIPVDATPEELRRAYRESARRLHPDTNKAPGETELFLDVQSAYEILSDPKRRAEYDASLPADLIEIPQLDFRLQYSRESLPVINERQLLYVLLEVLPPAEVLETSAAPLNLCLVVDSSTSMGGEQFDTVKNTAIEILRNMRTSDLFALVSFNDYAQVISPASFSKDKSYLETGIRMLRASGGTEIFRGLEAGYQELMKSARDGLSQHLILLTDGRTYGDEDACLEIARQAREAGIVISTLGIGSKWNDVFLDKLATTTGGSCTYVTQPAEIRRFLIERVFQVGRVYASPVILTGNLLPETRISYAFRLNPEVSPLETTLPISVGTLPRKGSLTILLELELPELENAHADLELGKLTLEMVIPSREAPYHHLRFKLVRPVIEGAGPPTPPPQMMQALSRLTFYRLQERAQAAVQSKNIAAATRSLRYLATNLLGKGENDLAEAVMKEIALLEENREFSEAGLKRIKYGTRSLAMLGERGASGRITG